MSEPSRNLYSRNPSWNLGTCRNLYLEPAGTFAREPRNLPEPLLGTLLGTSEPAGTRRDDCPRVPQGLVWLDRKAFSCWGIMNKIYTYKETNFENKTSFFRRYFPLTYQPHRIFPLRVLHINLTQLRRGWTSMLDSCLTKPLPKCSKVPAKYVPYPTKHVPQKKVSHSEIAGPWVILFEGPEP